MAPTRSIQASGEAAERRAHILSSLAAQPSCTRAEAKAAGAALGLSERQIYNWVRKLRAASGPVGAAVPRGSRTTKGLTRLPPEQEAHLSRIIAEEIARRPGGEVVGLFAALVKRCPLEMSPAPSASTIFRRLRALIGGGSARPATRPDAPEGKPGLQRRRLPEIPAEALLLPLPETVGHPADWRGFLHTLGHVAPLSPWLEAAERRRVALANLSDGIPPYGDMRQTALTVRGSHPMIERDAWALGRLQVLTPHDLWVPQRQLQRQFTTLEARLEAAEGVLDRLATAMLLLQGAGQVLSMNAMAERLVALADGLAIRGDKLELAARDEGEMLQRQIAEALHGGSDVVAAPGGVSRISRPSGRPAYEVLVTPIFDNRVRLGITGRLAAVFVRDPAARLVTPIEWVRTVFGLTQAEARLMQALLAGDRVEALQGRWNLGRETLRTQLKSVFHKTGVNRQSDLIRLGLRSLVTMYR